MLCSIKIPVKDGYRSIIVETPSKYTIEDVKEELRNMITDEDMKDNIDFISEMTIEDYGMKDFFIKHGFEIYNLKEKVLYMPNVLNKVIHIEDANGNALFAFEIDKDANIITRHNCTIADECDDYVLHTDKTAIRIQKEVR